MVEEVDEGGSLARLLPEIPLVICADPEDVAIRIYESLGFMRDSRHWAAQRRPSWDQLSPTA